ncbi:MAG TPA: polymer-forming cytoskeletal protein, partial [Pyrinomonadaceae bacterium]|nr:polymer-forming cytoskeletal protein [Pyrinomonadaceae bacterium]
MLRMGRNPKDEKADTTADHTPAPSTTPYASNNAASGSSSSSSGSSANASGGGSDYYQGTAHTPNTSRAVTESESLARDIKEGTLSGFVGNGTVLTGEASFKGMLRVDGHLSGRVSSQDGTLIISTNGQVDANIEVSVAQIYGTVNGDIIASKRIEMGRVARVTGNIQTPALVIENGALFEGSCRMVQPKESHDQRERDATSGVSGAASSTGSTSSTSTSAATGGASTGAGSSSSASGASSAKDRPTSGVSS